MEAVTALNTVTAEDIALDRELERIARETPPIADDIQVPTVTNLVDERDMLGDYVENYKPAQTIQELEAQMFQAQSVGADSIEVSPLLFTHYCGPDNGKNPNWVSKYFHFKQIKAYLAGSVDEAKDAASKTMEEVHFGKKE